MTDPRPALSPAARRAVIGLGVTQIIAWGSVYYMIGVIGPTLSDALGARPAVIYGGFSLSLVIGALLAPAVGRGVDRFGGRRVMAGGSVVAAIGLALTGLAQGPAGYGVACVVLGVAIAATLYDPAFAALTQIAGRGGRRAITLLTLFGGFASTLFWPLTSWLVAVIGWRETYALYAAAHVAICLPIHWRLLADEPDQSAFAAAAEDGETAREGLLQGGARRAAFWLFALALTANSFVFSGLSAHFIVMLGAMGMSERTAVLVGMAIGPSQVLARLVEMGSASRHGATFVGRVSAGLLPLGVVLLMLTAIHPLAAVGFALSYGAANGLITIAKGAVTLELFGARGYGATLGALSLPSLAARAAAPTLFALTNRAGVETTLVLCLALALAGFAAMEAVARMARAVNGPVDSSVDAA